MVSFSLITPSTPSHTTKDKEGGGGGGGKDGGKEKDGKEGKEKEGKDYGNLDFKIIVDSKNGQPTNIHLVAPTLQEKTAWISDISQVGGHSSFHLRVCVCV